VATQLRHDELNRFVAAAVFLIVGIGYAGPAVLIVLLVPVMFITWFVTRKSPFWSQPRLRYDSIEN